MKVKSTVCFVVFLMVFSVLVNAQTKSLGLNVPANMVENSKKAGAPFTKVELFNASSGNTPLAQPDIQQELTDFEVLTLQKERLNRFEKEKPEEMLFIIPDGQNGIIELELVQANIFADDFKVRLSSSDVAIEVETGTHYRGVVKNIPNSLASVSIFNGEIAATFSTPEKGNLVLNKVNGQLNSEQYILYADKDQVEPSEFTCGVQDVGPGYSKDQITANTVAGFAAKCTNIYFEVDNDVYQDKGGASQTVNYISSIFNEVATLYANEDLTVKISEIYLWDTSSPYTGTSSSAMLNKFQSYRKSFNGDLAQLISYKASGGIAVLDGLCHPYNSAKMSFASIGSSFRTIPNYSFTVMVVAHELGHLFGSHHTHACVWNGNNTAIDGCAGFVEGSCSNPGIPSGGGTIMSYCHLKSIGINFSLGFGTQPGNVIRNGVASASCLQTCTTDGGGGDNPPGGGGDNPPSGGCSDYEVTLSLIMDDFATETSWKIKDANGTTLHSGGPYKKGSKGTKMDETFCLKDGCFTFEIIDTYGDGMCCQYGRGSYLLKDSKGKTLASGGQFGFSDVKDFCFNDPGDGGNADCLEIDFNNFDVIPYGGVQDRGVFEIQENGKGLAIANNAWKAIEINYQVTPQTVVEFEFGSTLIAEIQGFGFDDNLSISSARSFKVYGFQNWGILDFDDYQSPGNWQKFKIPVGLYYSGNFKYLFFMADHDSGDQNGNALYRNIKIYEGDGCSNIVEELPANIKETVHFSGQLNIQPNPVSDILDLKISADILQKAKIAVFSTTGQLVKSLDWDLNQGLNHISIDVSHLHQGTYVLEVIGVHQKWNEKFVVVNH